MAALGERTPTPSSDYTQELQIAIIVGLVGFALFAIKKLLNRKRAKRKGPAVAAVRANSASNAVRAKPSPPPPASSPLQRETTRKEERQREDKPEHSQQQQRQQQAAQPPAPAAASGKKQPQKRTEQEEKPKEGKKKTAAAKKKQTAAKQKQQAPKAAAEADDKAVKAIAETVETKVAQPEPADVAEEPSNAAEEATPPAPEEAVPVSRKGSEKSDGAAGKSPESGSISNAVDKRPASDSKEARDSPVEESNEAGNSPVSKTLVINEASASPERVTNGGAIPPQDPIAESAEASEAAGACSVDASIRKEEPVRKPEPPVPVEVVAVAKAEPVKKGKRQKQQQQQQQQSSKKAAPTPPQPKAKKAQKAASGGAEAPSKTQAVPQKASAPPTPSEAAVEPLPPPPVKKEVVEEVNEPVPAEKKSQEVAPVLETPPVEEASKLAAEEEATGGADKPPSVVRESTPPPIFPENPLSWAEDEPDIVSPTVPCAPEAPRVAEKEPAPMPSSGVSQGSIPRAAPVPGQPFVPAQANTPTMPLGQPVDFSQMQANRPMGSFPAPEATPMGPFPPHPASWFPYGMPPPQFNPPLPPMCPDDGHCMLANDRVHQEQFRHTCRIPNCAHMHLDWHRRLFDHPQQKNQQQCVPVPRQQQQHPQQQQQFKRTTSGTRTASGNAGALPPQFAGDDTARDADMTGRIVLIHAATGSTLHMKGNWNKVKVGKLQALVQEHWLIPVSQQFLSTSAGVRLEGIAADGTSKPCSAFGVRPSVTVYVTDVGVPGHADLSRPIWDASNLQATASAARTGSGIAPQAYWPRLQAQPSPANQGPGADSSIQWSQEVRHESSYDDSSAYHIGY